MSTVDVVGIGQNAVDRLILAEHFPVYTGKERFHSEMQSPGGQVATAIAACAQLGLRTKYVGTICDDDAGRLQHKSLRSAGIDIADLITRPDCATQSAYIVIDGSGERTVPWRRDAALELRAEEIRSEWFADARMLHLDAGDLPAVTRAAEMARALGIPVSLDADTIYPELGPLFANVDYLIAASGLLEALTGESDVVKAIERTHREYGCRAVGVTLGADGAMLFTDGKLYYSPGFSINCVDTTGAGDVFHGAFCYSVLEAMSWPQTLDFCNAMAALNCRAFGARGALASRDEAAELVRTGARHRRAGF